MFRLEAKQNILYAKRKRNSERKLGFVSLVFGSKTENFVCETKWLEAKNTENMHTKMFKPAKISLPDLTAEIEEL